MGPILSSYATDFEKAKSRDPIPGCNLLALFICQKLKNPSFSETGVFKVLNKGRLKPTIEEIAHLYNEFKIEFEAMANRKNSSLENLIIFWDVNYGPKDELNKVLELWHQQVNSMHSKYCLPELVTGLQTLICFSIFRVNNEGSAIVNGELINPDTWTF